MCRREHYAPPLSRPGRDFRCPLHDDDKASLSISPGNRGQRMVWYCFGGCDPRDLRDEFLRLGIDPSCLGNYLARPREVSGSRAPHPAVDRATLAEARRWRAVRSLPAADLTAAQWAMCVQAISEGDGSLPGDPRQLLPADSGEFAALAARAGVRKSTRYKAAQIWMAQIAS